MAEATVLAAEARDRAGKGVARQTRRAGRIPAVIYGNKEKPVMISLDRLKFERVLRTPGFFTHLFDVKVSDASYHVLPRDVQFDPVTDIPIHVDFLRVSREVKVTVGVPVEFINTDQSPGLKRGGMLNIVRHEIEVECGAEEIPSHITVDVAGYDLGDSIHISAVTLPANVTPTITDRDFTIATIASPSAVKSEANSGEDTEAEEQE
ncbi:50S ribosomal protein L25 [Skermanella stibiiresistens SB22]|uniref:Large ribosomal subunit protein bL25 n=1 Tax=Skermanella stibiiresistens SB22 TaxID=1385369 RepID=W9H910_9PROT|nr:50S ribosomal protein L25/general stress protein Ctc [Skermanella stibiiresistens]EWY41142.1 50S ribosomal protein L25 [Skermanella stibiiresistens SB22]